MPTKDKMVRVLMWGLWSREQAEREREALRKVFNSQGAGPTHYAKIYHRGGKEGWEIHLWERGSND